MNLRQLRYFAKVVETGNITKASDLLHVAQPALTLQIRHLEQDLGTPLLVRHSRGVEATEAGRVLFERANEILLRVEAARREVGAYGGRVQELIRLGLSPSLMASVGPDLVVEARRQLPDLTIRLVEDLSFALVDRLERDELDLALAYDAEDKPGLVRTLLLEEQLVLAAVPSSLPPGPDIALAAALERELILSGPRDSVRRALELAAQRFSVSPILAFEVQSVAAIKQMTVRGLGSAILPAESVASEHARGELAVRRIVDPELTRKLYVVRVAQKLPMSREEYLLDLIHSILARIVDGSGGLSRTVLATEETRAWPRHHAAAST